MTISPYTQLFLLIGYFTHFLLNLKNNDDEVLSIDYIKDNLGKKADLLFVMSELGKKLNMSEVLGVLNKSESIEIGKDVPVIKIGENSSRIQIQNNITIKPKDIKFGSYRICIEDDGTLSFEEEGYPKISLDALKTILEEIQNNMIRNRSILYTLDNHVKDNYYTKENVYTKDEVDDTFVSKNEFNTSVNEALDNIQILNKGYTKEESNLIFLTRGELNNEFLTKTEANTKYNTII